MTEEDRKLWMERIEDYRSSGLTGPKWAETSSIALHKLRYYTNKFNNEKKVNSKEKPKDLQWVSVIPESPTVEKHANNPIRITIGEATIDVVSGFDKDTFESVTRILSQC